MAGVIVLTGRAKDTIVLSSGENIEPGSIEDAAVCSSLIKNCVVLGQDRRSLGALIVPDAEAFEEEGVLLCVLQAVGHPDFHMQVVILDFHCDGVSAASVMMSTSRLQISDNCLHSSMMQGAHQGVALCLLLKKCLVSQVRCQTSSNTT